MPQFNVLHSEIPLNTWWGFDINYKLSNNL
jgi:hypothetical protein